MYYPFDYFFWMVSSHNLLRTPLLPIASEHDRYSAVAWLSHLLLSKERKGPWQGVARNRGVDAEPDLYYIKWSRSWKVSMLICLRAVFFLFNLQIHWLLAWKWILCCKMILYSGVATHCPATGFLTTFCSQMIQVSSWQGKGKSESPSKGKGSDKGQNSTRCVFFQPLPWWNGEIVDCNALSIRTDTFEFCTNLYQMVSNDLKYLRSQFQFKVSHIIVMFTWICHNNRFLIHGMVAHGDE